MLRRLAFPVGFLFLLISVAFVMISYGGNKTASQNNLSSSDVLKQFQTNLVVRDGIVTDEGGTKLAMKDLIKDKTLVTFWNSNCGECKIELPIIVNFAASHSDIKFIFINKGDTVQDAKDALTNYGVKITSFYDEKSVVFTSWQSTMPGSFFVENGSIVYYFPGRISQEHLDALVK